MKLKIPKFKQSLKSPQGSMVIFLVFLIAVNYLVSQKSWYMDLTQDKIYTASDASKNILGELKKPVTVTFYISKELPSDAVIFKTQVQDVLNQYEDLSKGKLSVRYEEPDNENTTVQDLASKGIPQLQSEVVERDKIEVKNFFFGAIVSSGEGESEKKEVLASIGALESFEYDFVSAVYSVSKENKEIVAFLQGHGEKTMTMTDLAKSYTVENVNISTEAEKEGFYISPVSEPADTSDESVAIVEKEFVEPKSLIIAGPASNLSEAEISVLDGFVAGGGKVIVMAEKINIDLEQGFVAKNIETNINDFTRKYGIEINTDLVYDKSNEPISYTKQSYFGEIQMTSAYPFWVKAIKENFSDHPALSKIGSLTFLWSSSLKTENKDGYEIKNLITSTKDGEAVSENISITPESNLSFLSGGEETLAAISSAQGGGGQLIVIGDSDFASPAFMRSIADNEIFFTNLVDSVSSSANLSSIRTKNIANRPIKEISDSERNYWKFFAIAGGTIILSAYGFWRLRKRKRLSASV